MDAADRRAAAAAYKERKTAAGVFAVRCAATGQVWVGESRHLATQQNGLWFSLKHGSCMNRDVQAAWAAHGEDAFSFEPLEQLEADLSPYLVRTALKERSIEWRSKLAAARL
ncbi:GIY-YIG nuclease family protein [Caulobacter sp. 17J80-11]|uniref:GIY-YIG nuclease family protein n=1 Tax=Caulobacter sp. 17J80-11 TaxID=2763502 RepID=UPI0016538FAC|nr:GIY-YIG nuclease family protein [Caulobacter sp. 17J80-11]MBC6982216.1 GIY-YIG nuclease family protein [Caulobacter sp. 17J80-11]